MKLTVIVFAFVFVLILCIPLVFVDFTSDRVSTKENRMLANRPSLSIAKAHPGTYFREFDDWFKDSIGFRKKFIALNNIIDNRKLSGIKYTDGTYIYLIGEQGHHYFADINGGLILKFQGKPLFSDEQLQNAAKKFDDINGYLSSKEIPFIVMLCTDKETIYPEYYPKVIKRGPEPIQLDIVTQYFKKHTGVDVFNIREALVAEKEHYLLYNKSVTDFDHIQKFDLSHYNQIGAFFAYRELMKHINIYFPDIIPYTLDDIAIVYDENEIPTASVKQEKPYIKQNASFFNNVKFAPELTGSNEAFENDIAERSILLLRDSYAGEQYITKYLARHFGSTILIHYGNLVHFREYVETYHPDMVVFESSERQIQWFVASVLETQLP